MIIQETQLEKPSFLQAVAPIKIQKAVIAVKENFKDLALKSSAVDVALGVLIGAAVTPLATSFVEDIVVPPIALLFGGKELGSMHWVLKDGPTPGSYQTVEEAKKDGAVSLGKARQGIPLSDMVPLFKGQLIALLFLSLLTVWYA